MRLSKHFSHLHAGNHPNTNLQKDYTKYGFDNFTIEVLKTCDNLLEEERNFQINIGIDNLYNMKISNYYMADVALFVVDVMEVKNILMDIIGDIVIVKEIFLIMVMEIKKNKI